MTCKNGHTLTPENQRPYRKNGREYIECRECARDRKRKYELKQKMARIPKPHYSGRNCEGCGNYISPNSETGLCPKCESGPKVEPVELSLRKRVCVNCQEHWCYDRRVMAGQSVDGCRMWSAG